MLDVAVSAMGAGVVPTRDAVDGQVQFAQDQHVVE